ncbi:MAG TPA: hypothetical protein VI233_12000, partial [Puia sp.]
MRLFGGKKRKKIRVLATGGWGDMLLCTPTIKALRIKFPDAYIIVYVPEKIRSQLYFHSPHMNKISTTTILNNPVASYIFLYQFHKFIDLKYTRIMPGLFPIIPVIDLIANLANVELEDRRLQFFLSGQEERAALDFLKGHPNPIIVHMSTKGKNKTWIDQNWEEVIRRFPGYTFIQLGEDKDYALQGAVDMRGKTSFREAAALIKHSLSF